MNPIDQPQFRIFRTINRRSYLVAARSRVPRFIGMFIRAMETRYGELAVVVDGRRNEKQAAAWRVDEQFAGTVTVRPWVHEPTGEFFPGILFGYGVLPTKTIAKKLHFERYSNRPPPVHCGIRGLSVCEWAELPSFAEWAADFATARTGGFLPGHPPVPFATDEIMPESAFTITIARRLGL